MTNGNNDNENWRQRALPKVLFVVVAAVGLTWLTVRLWLPILRMLGSDTDPPSWYAVAIVAGTFAVIGLLVYFVADRTLWELLELLVVPFALAGVGLWFTMQQEARQEETEKQRAQDAALQAYLDQMSTLLIENDLRTAPGDSEVRTLARARTLTVLSTLGPEDKPSVLQFLYESDLILRKGPGTSVFPGTSVDSVPPNCTPQVGLRAIFSIVSLQGTDLRDAPLSGANLTGANLSGADLSGADLSGADLRSTVLQVADLSGADLRHADLAPASSVTQPVPSQAISILQNADLSGADLRSTVLRSADLCSAKLNKASKISGVDLSGTALVGVKGVTIDRLVKEAESLDGAMMPNMRMCEELPACKGHGKDGENTGPP